jgi:hypothetical protein
MTEIVIAAAGFFDGTRFGNERESRIVSSRDLSALRWGEVSDAPFDRFGRLDGLCKSAVIAVEMLGLPPATGDARPGMAIAVGTEYGSVEVDAAFFRTRNQAGGASPLLFSYTLPSTVIGEIAIRQRITGPNACYMAGRESGALALWEGAHLVLSGEASACVCVACDSISPPASPEPFTAAWAFLVENADRCEHASLGQIVFGLARSRPRRGTGDLAGLFKFLASADIERSDFVIQAPCALRGTSDMLIRHMRRDRGRTG